VYSTTVEVRETRAGGIHIAATCTCSAVRAAIGTRVLRASTLAERLRGALEDSRASEGP
jgi:hypothetical protein